MQNSFAIGVAQHGPAIGLSPPGGSGPDLVPDVGGVRRMGDFDRDEDEVGEVPEHRLTLPEHHRDDIDDEFAERARPRGFHLRHTSGR